MVEAVLQSAVELRAEVVLIQEPREGKDGTVSHPGFRDIMKEKKVWIAVSNEARCRIDLVDVGGGEGYVQAVDIMHSQPAENSSGQRVRPKDAGQQPETSGGN